MPRPGQALSRQRPAKARANNRTSRRPTDRDLIPTVKAGKGQETPRGAGLGDSALVGYVGVLTNRFQAAWNQPTGEMALGKMLAVTVKLKVEPDGTVTEFDIVEGSGNAVVDDSVREAGKKITKLPPPPNGQAFSAPVRFELGN